MIGQMHESIKIAYPQRRVNIILRFFLDRLSVVTLSYLDNQWNVIHQIVYVTYKPNDTSTYCFYPKCTFKNIKCLYKLYTYLYIVSYKFDLFFISINSDLLDFLNFIEILYNLQFIITLKKKTIFMST